MATAIIFLATLAAMLATAGDIGLTWDEPAYLHSARGDRQPVPALPQQDPGSPISPADRHTQCSMVRWFDELIHAPDWEAVRHVLSQQRILSAWDYNRYGPNFHPPLSGMLAALGWLATGRWLDEIAAWRVASGVEFALVIAVLFFFLARRYGPWVGGTAAASLAVMPRVVGDGHNFGTDMPVMAVWAVTSLAFWAGLEARWGRILFGILLGLCFITKFTAMLIVVPLGLWLICYRVIPRFSLHTCAQSALATLMVAWPLGLGGYEIVRLAAAIRLTTQERMLQGVTQGAAGKDLAAVIGHAAPFAERELRWAAGYLAANLPAQPPAGVTREQWGSLRDRLDLDRHNAYVDVLDLGVHARYPGWILLLPVPLWALWSCLVRLLPRLGSPSAALALWLSGLALAPAVAIAANPTWWHDTLAQLAHYYQISAGRQGALPDIEIFYLGKKYVYSLPWHNGWVLTLVTVPAGVLALAGLGFGSALVHWRRDPLPVYFIFHMLALPAIRMLPTPAHDGVRLMLPTFFFLAGLAGWGFGVIEHLVGRFRSEEYSTAPVLAVAAAPLLLPAAYGLVRTHPYELSCYNGLVGGLPGAHRLGFEPTYWYDAVTPEVRDYLNDPQRGLPVGAALGLPDPRINPPVFSELYDMGKLRADIRFDAGQRDAFPYIPLLTHSSKSTPFTRLMYALQPQESWGHRGVRLFSLYSPTTVSRAWALWIMLVAEDGTRPGSVARADRELIRQCRDNYRPLYAAALRVTEQGLEQALASEEDEPTLAVIRRMAARRELMELLLRRRKQALVEAAEIINHTAGRHAELLERIIEYEGYLPAEELGEYLDQSFSALPEPGH